MAGLNLSAFEIIGPAMVGPSSSHTAGAARIGLIARHLLDEPPVHAQFELHGSFAATGKGHATDRALLAGVLGEAADSERLAESFALAPAAGVAFEFYAIDLGDESHPNSVRLTLRGASRTLTLTAASLGGGVVEVSELDGHPVRFRGTRPTLVCWHLDHPGFLAALTTQFAALAFNIATLTTTRKNRGGDALTLVESDETIPPSLRANVAQLAGVQRVGGLSPLP